HGAPRDPEGYATVQVGQLGLLVDWFPDPEGGLHFGGIAGVGSASVRDSWIPDSTGSVFAGTILGGYDFWVGPQWSLGLEAFVSGTTSADLKDKDQHATDYSLRALSVGVGYSLLHH